MHNQSSIATACDQRIIAPPLKASKITFPIYFDCPQAVAGNHKTEEYDRIIWVKLEKLDIGLLILLDIDSLNEITVSASLSTLQLIRLINEGQIVCLFNYIHSLHLMGKIIKLH